MRRTIDMESPGERRLRTDLAGVRFLAGVADGFWDRVEKSTAARPFDAGSYAKQSVRRDLHLMGGTGLEHIKKSSEEQTIPSLGGAESGDVPVSYFRNPCSSTRNHLQDFAGRS